MAGDAARDEALLKLIAAFNAMTRQAKLVESMSENDPNKRVEKVNLAQVERQLWSQHADYTQRYGLIQQYQLSTTFH